MVTASSGTWNRLRKARVRLQLGAGQDQQGAVEVLDHVGIEGLLIVDLNGLGLTGAELVVINAFFGQLERQPETLFDPPSD